MKELVQELVSVSGRFYSRFIISDLFSFVLPGSIVLATLVYLADATRILTIASEHSVALLLIAWWGTSHLLGFAVQALGLSTRLLLLFPNGEPNEKRYRTFQQFAKKHSQSEDGGFVYAWSEKSIHQKQMAGNGAVAILLSVLSCLLVIALRRFGVDAAPTVAILVIVLLAIVLLVEHRRVVREWWKWVETSLEK